MEMVCQNYDNGDILRVVKELCEGKESCNIIPYDDMIMMMMVMIMMMRMMIMIMHERYFFDGFKLYVHDMELKYKF